MSTLVVSQSLIAGENTVAPPVLAPTLDVLATGSIPSIVRFPEVTTAALGEEDAYYMPFPGFTTFALGEEDAYIGQPTTLAIGEEDAGVLPIVTTLAIGEEEMPFLGRFISGSDGNDTLEGGTGNDTLTGGIGLDTFNVTSGSDTITDLGRGGADVLRVSAGATADATVTAAWTATAASVNRGIGNLKTAGFAVNLAAVTAGTNGFNVTNTSSTGTTLTGSGLNDTLTGNSGVDNLNGGAGADILNGGAGNDILTGGSGADTMDGGDGSDIYILALAADYATGEVIADTGSTGTDELRFTTTAASTLTLANTVSGIENIVIGTGTGATAVATGTTAINVNAAALTYGVSIAGNAGANQLTGGNGNDSINGNAGNDTLSGGAGDDTYIVDNASDVVTEESSAGTDTIQSSMTYSLATLTHVENLTLTGTAAINGTGNALANTLTGNAAANTLDGGAGADTLVGGDGNDIYVVDNADDIITETNTTLTQIDEVRSSVSWTLGANLEKLTLVGTAAINGTGNALANTLTGNAANNTLDGNGGVDTLIGGLGDDTYIVDLVSTTGALQDTVSEVASAGTDTLRLRGTSTNATALTLTLAATLENLDASNTGSSKVNLTGNTANNILTGNAADNILNGLAGADTMIGGAGNDTYVVDSASDVVTEETNGGTDLVQVAIAAAGGTYTLGSHVENATLTNTLAYSLTGNSLNNTLTGNAAANTLDGGDGNDILDGLAGADTMIGGAGNDTLTGGTGADNLTGGLGSDTFVFAPSHSGQTSRFDTITDYLTGVLGTGDVIDYNVNLSVGGSSLAATSAQASINQSNGVATFAAGSGTTLSDALADIAARFTAATNSAGEFAFFKVRNTGNFYMFISDGTAGVTSNDVVIQFAGVTNINTIDLTAGNLTMIAGLGR